MATNGLPDLFQVDLSVFEDPNLQRFVVDLVPGMPATHLEPNRNDDDTSSDSFANSSSLLNLLCYKKRDLGSPDVLITLKDARGFSETFQAHRNILCERSSFLGALLNDRAWSSTPQPVLIHLLLPEQHSPFARAALKATYVLQDASPDSITHLHLLHEKVGWDMDLLGFLAEVGNVARMLQIGVVQDAVCLAITPILTQPTVRYHAFSGDRDSLLRFAFHSNAVEERELLRLLQKMTILIIKQDMERGSELWKSQLLNTPQVLAQLFDTFAVWRSDLPALQTAPLSGVIDDSGVEPTDLESARTEAGTTDTINTNSMQAYCSDELSETSYELPALRTPSASNTVSTSGHDNPPDADQASSVGSPIREIVDEPRESTRKDSMASDELDWNATSWNTPQSSDLWDQPSFPDLHSKLDTSTDSAANAEQLTMPVQHFDWSTHDLEVPDESKKCKLDRRSNGHGTLGYRCYVGGHWKCYH